MRLLEGLDELGGSLYRRPESVPTAAVDKNGEPPFCSLQGDVAATGASRQLADELELFQGAAGRWLCLGRRCPGQETVVAGR